MRSVRRAPFAFGAGALPLAFVLALTCAGLAGGAAAQALTPVPTPDLAPRALGAEELDAVTLARMALRFELDAVALEVLGRSGAPGLILGVVVEGQTVFAEAYGSAEVGGRDLPLDAPLWLASLSKPLTAVGVLRLAADGRLDLDDDASRWLPPGALGPPADPADGPVTLRHLLTHTAGLDVRSLGLTVPPDEPMPSTTEAVAAGLPPRVDTPGARLVYCNACYGALAAVLAQATGLDEASAYRSLVFDPLGFEEATVLADAGPEYEAATVTPHAVGADGVRPLIMPRLVQSGAGRVRASALDVLRFAEALTAPTPPAVLADGVREALMTPAMRPHPVAPGWTLGLAESAVLGHPVVRHDGDLPGVRASLVIAPDARVAVFAYLNGDPIADGLEAVSGVRDARAVLVEETFRRLLGDGRDPEVPGIGWPPGETAGLTPRPGVYRTERSAVGGLERVLTAAAPSFLVQVADDDVTVVPPAAWAAAITFEQDATGTWRSRTDGAPLVALAPTDTDPPRVLVHLGGTLGLAWVPWWERAWLVAASVAAALAAALLVLVTWPVGAFWRWRRREPVGAALPATLVVTRAWSRVGAVLVAAIVGALVWLASLALATGDAPLTTSAPLLQAAALGLALAVLAQLIQTWRGWRRWPRLRARWLAHLLIAAAFAALLAQGWIWGLWSPEALANTWSALSA